MKQYLLLQINDALFPVGGYSHSYGLETYIQKNLVADAKEASQYVMHYIENNLLYGELLAVKLAFEACKKENPMEELAALEQMITASRVPYELRQASEKIASRFMKTLRSLQMNLEQNWFESYSALRRPWMHKNYAVAYGVFCASAGLSLEDSLAHLLYAQTSALVTNCVKTIPLSQTAGQQILYQALQHFDSIIAGVKEKTEADYALSLPGADIRSMQHEHLYSRLYMS